MGQCGTFSVWIGVMLNCLAVSSMNVFMTLSKLFCFFRNHRINDVDATIGMSQVQKPNWSMPITRTEAAITEDKSILAGMVSIGISLHLIILPLSEINKILIKHHLLPKISKSKLFQPRSDLIMKLRLFNLSSRLSRNLNLSIFWSEK